jgi:dUTP pyrophosphatase
MAEKTRGFEICDKYRGHGLHLPQRQTLASAGYDLAAAEDITIPSIWHQRFVRLFRLLCNRSFLNESDLRQANQALQPTLVPTGVRAYMPDDEMLLIANRSSNTVKRRLALPNGIGVIDADYYDNEKNEGEIFVQMVNYGVRDFKVSKGDRIAQGIFVHYLKTDQDQPKGQKRQGGFGSSGF